MKKVSLLLLLSLGYMIISSHLYSQVVLPSTITTDTRLGPGGSPAGQAGEAGL